MRGMFVPSCFACMHCIMGERAEPRRSGSVRLGLYIVLRNLIGQCLLIAGKGLWILQTKKLHTNRGEDALSSTLAGRTISTGPSLRGSHLPRQRKPCSQLTRGLQVPASCWQDIKWPSHQNLYSLRPWWPFSSWPLWHVISLDICISIIIKKNCPQWHWTLSLFVLFQKDEERKSRPTRVVMVAYYSSSTVCSLEYCSEYIYPQLPISHFCCMRWILMSVSCTKHCSRRCFRRLLLPFPPYCMNSKSSWTNKTTMKLFSAKFKRKTTDVLVVMVVVMVYLLCDSKISGIFPQSPTIQLPLSICCMRWMLVSGVQSIAWVALSDGLQCYLYPCPLPSPYWENSNNSQTNTQSWKCFVLGVTK